MAGDVADKSAVVYDGFRSRTAVDEVVVDGGEKVGKSWKSEETKERERKKKVLVYELHGWHLEEKNSEAKTWRGWGDFFVQSRVLTGKRKNESELWACRAHTLEQAGKHAVDST